MLRFGFILFLALYGCGSDDGARAVVAPAAVECASVELANVRLVSDSACTVATHALTATKLADLQFTPSENLCFVVGPAEIRFTSADGETVVGQATAYSGIVSNPVAAAGIQSFDQPCDTEGPVLAFTAATVAELSRSSGGAPVGQLVMRDTGWAELNPATAFPAFVSERLVVVAGAGGVLADAVGELYLTGDEFSGAPAFGSICAPGLLDGLKQLFEG